MIRGICALLLALALVVPFVSQARENPAAGDEDPFPLMCADFSGSWKSDAGDRYNIEQRQCSYLKMEMSYGSESEITTIIPDNKTRADRGTQVRHRWNSPYDATVLESHRNFVMDAGTRVAVVTMFERISQNLLLQTTYTTTEYINAPGQAPHHEYNQVVFRLMDSGSEDGLRLPSPRKRSKH